ncbi:phage tail protein, partial [Enterococcus casseliflavus]|uniref:phage tail protein n=1 Tax=Enterococcus casseliflavus TaxID=37734 RepID=UPI003D6C5FFA
MIIFFFDRFWNPLGKASAKLPKGVTYYDDHEVEDVETGTSTFEVYVGFDEENRNIVRAYGQEATYFVTTDQEDHGRLWSVIDDESDEEAMFHYFYGEDAGMDLINEMLPAWGSPGSAKPIVYYIERAAADSGFEIGINEIPNLTRTLDWESEATGLNRLQSIFTQFDNAELQFRFDIDENTLALKHKYIDILKKRGNNTGIELRMNREVKNIRMKRSRANMFNAYRCYGATPEGKENPITLNGYSLTTAQKEINPETGKARFVLSGNILKDTESNAKYSRYLNPYEQGEDEGYYTGIYNSEATTQNALANETILQLKKTGYPEVNYEVDVIDAPRTLKAGDYVSIVNDKDELYLEGRILKTDRSRSNDTFEITLGDYLIRDSGIAEQIQAMADKLKGKDGVSNFIFYAYADDDKGTGFSLNPQGKKYTGLTVSLVNQQPSDPSVYTWSLSKGSDGRGILGSPVSTFAKSKDGTIPPTTWSSTRPNVEPGEYLWTRIITTYTDNTTSETQTPTLMGADGPSGLGIRDKSISYAVGTSGNTPPSIGWQVTIPIVSANQYLWTRTTIVYTDDSKTDAYSVGKMGADGANAKLLYLTASAENMAFNADDTPKTTQTINISAKLQNVTGTATFTAIPYIGNTAQTAITLGGIGNTRTLTSSQWTNKDWTLIAITATLDNLSDTLSIVKVKDGKEGETYYPHRGYLMADGTFTKVYPNENLIVGSISPSSLVGTNSANQGMYPYRFSFGALKNIPAKLGDAVVIAYDWEVLGDDVAGTFLPQFGNTPYAIANRESFTVTNTNKKGTSSFITSVAASWLASTAVAVNLGFRADNLKGTLKITNFRFLISDVDSGWLPSPSEDYENAYPKYEGFYSDTNQVGSDNPDDYKPWVPFMGPQGGQGPKGDSAPLISLSGATQAITVDKDGKIKPASSFAVTGTAVNTAISNWTYSLNGGNFGSALPTGVTRSGNTVTIDPTKAVFDTLTIKAADATVSDVFTISRIKDGGEGPPGADAYTVFLTNESYTFAGSTTAALAGSTTTEVIVYKGINKITPSSITVGTKPTGLSSSVSGSIITLTATTALVSKSGTVPITITADGKIFTKQFSYALSLQGGKGDPGDPGKGVSAEEISYAISQDGTTPPTSGWSGTRPTPKAGWYMWTRTRFKYTDNTYSAYFYLVAQQGKDAVIISATAPTNPVKEDLWQDPNDTTGTVYRWDGTSWVHWGVSIDNLIVSNVQIENGVFKRVEGTVIVGSKFVNSFSYSDGGVTYTGSTTIEDGNV